MAIGIEEKGAKSNTFLLGGPERATDLIFPDQLAPWKKREDPRHHYVRRV
jgi:hypothetical protein